MSEIEVKILNIDVLKLRNKLINLNAKLVKKEKQFNYIYDFEGDTLKKNHKGYCRIRKSESLIDGSVKYFLTLKKMISQEKYKEMIEEETEVYNFEAMQNILKELGLYVRHANTKMRESYELDGILYEIDEWDKDFFPAPYLEVEAESEEKLLQGINLIGYTIKDTTSKTIDELRKEPGIE
jgi:adenylate cyclase class 2